MIGTWILLVALVSVAFVLGWVARHEVPHYHERRALVTTANELQCPARLHWIATASAVDRQFMLHQIIVEGQTWLAAFEACTDGAADVKTFLNLAHEIERHCTRRQDGPQTKTDS